MTLRSAAPVIRQRILPVLRLKTPERAIQAVELLRQAGFQSFELTMTVPNALEVIREVSAQGHEVGAGTVTNPRQAELALQAGARYLVSPGLVPEVLREFGAQVPVIPGAFTPTEVMRAQDLGARTVKIFPASSGGPEHLRALKSVLPDLDFIPTGGLTLESIPAYYAAGAACVGTGSDLISDQRLERSTPEEIVHHARRYLAQAREREESLI